MTVAILGPTAVGKSALAMALAERMDGELINADALQVYRDFDIGTAKPTHAERARVPHHLVDILDPDERYSAGEFARRARQAIGEIEARGKLPIVVGGSGLYLRALCEGISPVPPGDPAVRAELTQRLANEGLPALRQQLRQLDPETASRTAEADRQRTLRALEVALVSGRALSLWVADQPFGEGGLAVVKVGLTLPRALLYDRIAERISRMLTEGWLREVESLLLSGMSPALPAFQAIGYKQLVRHLREGWALDLATEDTIRATRRFAKRQITWFRRESEVTWFGAQEPQLDHLVFKRLQGLEIRGAQNA